MKLLIDIPEHIYEHAKETTEDSRDEFDAMRAIANGTQQESRSENPNKWMESDKCVKYKNVAIDLLKAYLESEQAVIGEYSGDFKESALELKKHVLGYLKRLDEGEDTFNELVKDMWLFDDWEVDS